MTCALRMRSSVSLTCSIITVQSANAFGRLTRPFLSVVRVSVATDAPSQHPGINRHHRKAKWDCGQVGLPHLLSLRRRPARLSFLDRAAPALPAGRPHELPVTDDDDATAHDDSERG